jgi:hypothetical protein
MRMTPDPEEHPSRIVTETGLPQLQRGLRGNQAPEEARDSRPEKRTLGGFVHFLMGLSLFFPGFAVLTVGRTTGVQVALVLAAVCGVIRICSGRIRRDIPVFLCLIGWVMSLIVSVAISGWNSPQIHGMIVYDASLLMITIFGLKCNIPRSYDLSLLRGLIAGAVISVVYALYQQGTFRLGLPYGIPPLNNPSFILYTDNEDIGLRSFAFFSEPSILAAYLLPLATAFFFIASNQRGAKAVRAWFLSLFLFVGIVATGSFSVFVSMPITLLLCLATQRRGLNVLLKGLVALLSIGFVLGTLIATTPWAASLSETLVERLADASHDPSLVSRYGTDVAGFEIFKEHPLFGAGVAPDADYFISRLPAESTHYQAVDTLTLAPSLPVAILSAQGIFGLLFLGTLSFLAIVRSQRNMFLRLIFIGCLVVMTVQCANPDLYLIWVIMGLCLSQSPGVSAPRREAAVLSTRLQTQLPIEQEQG